MRASITKMTTESLPAALGLERGPALVSIVGGGGKSALLFGLGEVLPGNTLLSTTTRIFAAQTGRAQRTFEVSSGVERIPSALDQAIRAREPGLLLIGAVEGDKAVGVDAELPGQLLARPDVDYVVVEADGSRMLPTKAPAAHEPVVPAETTHFVVMAGIDALDGPIRDTCHRPERVADLLRGSVDDPLVPETMAALLTDSAGGLQGAPDRSRCRRMVFLNKVETEAQRVHARLVAEHCLQRPGVDRVVIGALEPGHSSGDGDARSYEVWRSDSRTGD